MVINYTAFLRRNSDGERRMAHETADFHFDRNIDREAAISAIRFNWFENNFSCDCNRHLAFGRAMQPGFWEDHPCGETAYSVDRIVIDDGTELTPGGW